jgi:hypothetical protein
MRTRNKISFKNRLLAFEEIQEMKKRAKWMRFLNIITVMTEEGIKSMNWKLSLKRV